MHATLRISTGDRTVSLRSDEQPVAIGGSREAPKHSYGKLLGANAESKTAALSLGSLHKIEPGDEFDIQVFTQGYWKLTITDVSPESSTGRLEWFRSNAMATNPPFPKRGWEATLILKK